MKAVLLIDHGGPDTLQYGDTPDPTEGPGEVVVDIFAASVNGADKGAAWRRPLQPRLTFPHILGRDFSGVVRVVGAGVTDCGWRCRLRCDRQGIEGAYAEKIAIKAAIVARKAS